MPSPPAPPPGSPAPGPAAGGSSDDAPPVPAAKVFVLSGPSGSGKTTAVRRLTARCRCPILVAVSATTRPPRDGEADGTDYHFLSDGEFAARRDRGEFLECAEVHGRGFWYGTPWSEIERAAERGAWVLLEIDVQGAQTVLDRYPDAVTVFLRTPGEKEYEQRLRARGTEDEAAIRRRIETARTELAAADRYRFQVYNDDLDRAVREMCAILEAADPDAGAAPTHDRTN